MKRQTKQEAALARTQADAAFKQRVVDCHAQIVAADAADDLIARFRARERLATMSNDSPLLTSAERGELAEWIDSHRPAYEAACLAAAWQSLPTRLRAYATEKDASAQKLTADLTAAMTAGNDSTLRVLSWSESVFMDAALAAVAREIARMIEVKPLVDKTPSEGFTMLLAQIDHYAARRGRDLARSSSTTSNLADNCLRVAWFEMVEKKDRFMLDWKIY